MKEWEIKCQSSLYVTRSDTPAPAFTTILFTFYAVTSVLLFTTAKSTHLKPLSLLVKVKTTLPSQHILHLGRSFDENFWVRMLKILNPESPGKVTKTWEQSHNPILSVNHEFGLHCMQHFFFLLLFFSLAGQRLLVTSLLNNFSWIYPWLYLITKN